MSYPVQDLRAFLSGRWRITRRIHDVRQGLVGRVAGHGNFAAAPEGLIYAETGLLRFGSYRGEAARRYLFMFDQSNRAHVHHEDGSLFHPLDLSSGTDDMDHSCGEDRYRGRYRVLNRDTYVVSWDVTGPRKCYRMATFYTRQEG